MFFYDFFRIRGQQLFGVDTSSQKIAKITNAQKGGDKLTIKINETAIAKPVAPLSVDDVRLMTPPQYAKFFINEVKKGYSDPYGGMVYPLLDETIFLQNQHNLKKFWQPFTESHLSIGIREEKNQSKKRNTQKINLAKKGKIKIAVLSEMERFFKLARTHFAKNC